LDFVHNSSVGLPAEFSELYAMTRRGIGSISDITQKMNFKPNSPIRPL